MNKSSLGFNLLLVGDRHQTCGRPLTHVVEEAGRAGVSAFQFREKDLSPHDQLELASQIDVVTRRFGVRLFINDRIDLCMALGAAGVHLPSSGLPSPVARSLLGEDRLMGVSCHGLEEVKRAEIGGADFALLGPIYDTPSKLPYGPALGVDLIVKVKHQTSIPLFVIGGITRNRLKEVFGTGADGVGMISEVCSAQDIYRRCTELLDEIQQLSAC